MSVLLNLRISIPFYSIIFYYYFLNFLVNLVALLVYQRAFSVKINELITVSMR